MKFHKSWLFALLALFLSLSHSLAALEPWSYDPGPNPTTPMGRELIDIHAEIPNMPGISHFVIGSQKFRPAFGPVLWRMRQEPNSVKILFIGQDATHIAEAAGRTATAGFGGRAQDLANFFGVDESAAFINTYAYTIRGQYGAFQTPFISLKSDGTPELKFSGFVDNNLWLLTHDPASPIAQWRNRFLDWILRNNKDSLKLIVLFGGSARDAAATFIEAKGGKVGTRMQVESMHSVQVPETALKYAGGNNEFPIPLTIDGQDLYATILKRQPDYVKAEEQSAAMAALKEELGQWMEKMAFTKGGPYGNGLMHPAQLGGFDLGQISINGRRTISLKGIPLSDGSKVKHDVLVAQLPHPSALSRMTNEAASKAVADALKVFRPYLENGWKIQADPGFSNKFALGESYRYARAEIGPEYYDFGTPATRMVSVSDASRMSPHVIVFGTRDRAKFDQEKIKGMTEAQPGRLPDHGESFVSRPRLPESRYIFDPGPGEKFARLMKESLPLEKILLPKRGMSWKEHGIDAFNIKSHPDNRDFGHYRGTFKNPEVIILADPDGFDDLITSRALTGSRGQYLHGLMEDLKVKDQYLVIKTVPFAMDGATPTEWNEVLALTNTYREKLLKAALAGSKPKLILADGPYAANELKRILRDSPSAPVVAISRAAGLGASGLKGAAEAIRKQKLFPSFRFSGAMSDIPRSHLSYYARIWEGTSGDRVLNADDKNKGKAFAEVVPRWAFEQNWELSDWEIKGVRELRQKLEDNRLPQPGENFPDFLRRLNRLSSLPAPAALAA